MIIAKPHIDFIVNEGNQNKSSESKPYFRYEKKKPQNFANLNIRVQKVLKHGSKSGKKKKKAATYWNVWFLCTESRKKQKPMPFN